MRSKELAIEHADPTLSHPDWAVTMFSFTTDLTSGERRPIQVIEDVLDAGWTDRIEIDGPQHFRTYPHVSGAEIEELRELAGQRGVRFSILGIYNDLASRRNSLFDLDESERYIADQIRAAADLGFEATRIMFGVAPELLERLAPHAERHGVLVLQEVQGGTRPDAAEFERQREKIDRIGSEKLGFVFDLSACMAGLPVTYLEALRRGGVPDAVVHYLEDAWIAEPIAIVQQKVSALTADLALAPSTRGRLAMPFGRFGNSTVSDWRDSLQEFRAIHLKYWDLEDDGGRVSTPIADLRREFGAIGYSGTVTSEWGGHDWFSPASDAGAMEMTWQHRLLYDRSC